MLGRSDAASHPAGLSDGGFVKRRSKRDKEREADGRQKRGGGRLDERGRERDGRTATAEEGVTVTTGRWREIEGNREVAGSCFCSLTAWQSSLD